nr:non-specific lipid-transfer protein 2-like [Ipomoea batatas]
MTLALVLLLFLGEAQFSLATCDAKQLNPCLSALTFNLHPPPQCCERLNQQKPCFCQYVKNPNLKDYLVNSAAAKKVYELCKTLSDEARMETVRLKLRYESCFTVRAQGRSGGLALLWNGGIDVEVSLFFTLSSVVSHGGFQRHHVGWGKGGEGFRPGMVIEGLP